MTVKVIRTEDLASISFFFPWFFCPWVLLPLSFFLTSTCLLNSYSHLEGASEPLPFLFQPDENLKKALNFYKLCRPSDSPRLSSLCCPVPPTRRQVLHGRGNFLTLPSLPVVQREASQITLGRLTQDHRRLDEIIIVSWPLWRLPSSDHRGFPSCVLSCPCTVLSGKARMKDDNFRGSWLEEAFGAASQSLMIVFKLLLTFKTWVVSHNEPYR